MESTSEAGLKTGAVAAMQEKITEQNLGRKFDTSKPRTAELLSDFALALEAVAIVGEMGAQKYDLHNWPLVQNGINRYENAQERHKIERWKGELYDKESNIQHRAHEVWNALACLQLALSGPGAAPLRRVVVTTDGGTY